MLDRLELAQRRYRQIRPNPAGPLTSGKAQELSLWLETDVCAVVGFLRLGALAP